MTGASGPPIDVAPEIRTRFAGFPAPEGAFDPTKATQAELRKYGLPPRPDAVAQPALRSIWDQVFGRDLKLQAFVFHDELVTRAPFRILRRQLVERPVSTTRFETSLNWSGAYITANAYRRFLQVWGKWRAPTTLKLPPALLTGAPNTGYMCSAWIGLDGQRLYLDSTLPQMGTAFLLDGSGHTTAYAWVQWWAQNVQVPQVLTLGLAVTPGDTVACVLTAWDPQTVVFTIVNLSASPPTAMAVKGTAPTVTLLSNEAVTPDIAGATAEWIVERPRIPGVETLYDFPDYGQVDFTLCAAVEGAEVDIMSLPTGRLQELQGARLIRMFQMLPAPTRTAFISMPSKLDNSSITLRYGSF